MQNRFVGDDGKRRLVETLQRQDVVRGNSEIAEEIASACEVTDIAPRTALIVQGEAGADTYFILSGVLLSRLMALR